MTPIVLFTVASAIAAVGSFIFFLFTVKATQHVEDVLDTILEALGQEHQEVDPNWKPKNTPFDPR